MKHILFGNILLNNYKFIILIFFELLKVYCTEFDIFCSYRVFMFKKKIFRSDFSDIGRDWGNCHNSKIMKLNYIYTVDGSN